MNWNYLVFGLVGTKPDAACGAGVAGSTGAEYRGDPAHRGVERWRYDRKTVKRTGNTLRPYESPKEGDCYVDDGA